MTPQIDLVLEKLQSVNQLIDEGQPGSTTIQVDTNRLSVQQVDDKSGLQLCVEQIIRIAKRTTLNLSIKPESIYLEWH